MLDDSLLTRGAARPLLDPSSASGQIGTVTVEDVDADE
jgi:hypothetical protein